SSAFRGLNGSWPAGSSSSEKIASTGHSGSHNVQSMHSSGSITRKFGPSWKQSTGQTSTQSMYLHLMQFSVTTNVMSAGSGADAGARYSATRVPWSPKSPSGLAARDTVAIGDVQFLASGGAVRKVMAQSENAALKCDLVPWNITFFDQLDLEALRSDAEARLNQPGTEEYVYLSRTQSMENGEHRADFNDRLGLFDRFTRRGLHQGFIVLHEAGGNRPESQAGLDGTAAHQDCSFPLRHASGDELRVLIVDGPAALADEAGQVVTGRNSQTDALSAVTAEVHAGFARTISGSCIGCACRVQGRTRREIRVPRVSCTRRRRKCHCDAARPRPPRRS